MGIRFDRTALLDRLEPVKYDAEATDEQANLEQMSLAGVLLTLAEIDHEREFQQCQRVARHLLGSLYEPEDIALE